MGTVENPHAGQGMVVIDIGGEIGALVVTLPSSMAGIEIEICPAGARGTTPDEGGEWWQGEWHSPAHFEEHDHDHGHDHGHGHGHDHGPAWPHVEVMGRPLGDRLVYSAVYPGLRQGDYELWIRPDEPTSLTVTVHGAEVTMVDWPS